MSLHDVPNFQILFQYLQKAEPKRYDQFLRIHGFHLLANQVILKILLLLPLLMVMVKMTIMLMVMLVLMMMMMMMMNIFPENRANKCVYYIFCFVVSSFMIMPLRKC